MMSWISNWWKWWWMKLSCVNWRSVKYLGCKWNNGVKQLHGYGDDVCWFVTFLCFLYNPSVLVFVIVLVLMWTRFLWECFCESSWERFYNILWVWWLDSILVFQLFWMRECVNAMDEAVNASMWPLCVLIWYEQFHPMSGWLCCQKWVYGFLVWMLCSCWGMYGMLLLSKLSSYR